MKLKSLLTFTALSLTQLLSAADVEQEYMEARAEMQKYNSAYNEYQKELQATDKKFAQRIEAVSLTRKKYSDALKTAEKNDPEIQDIDKQIEALQTKRMTLVKQLGKKVTKETKAFREALKARDLYQKEALAASPEGQALLKKLEFARFNYSTSIKKYKMVKGHSPSSKSNHSRSAKGGHKHTSSCSHSK